MRRTVEINSSGIPVAGLGGLGLVGAAVVMAIAFPEARLIVLAGAIGGSLLSVALVLARRRRNHSTPSGDSPAVLFRESDGARPPARPPQDDSGQHRRIQVLAASR